MNKKSHVTLRSSGDADLRALVYRMQLRLSSTSSRWCPGFFCRETYSAHLSWSMFQEPSHYDWQARREKFSLLVSCATEPKYLLSRKNVCVSSSGKTMCSSFFFLGQRIDIQEHKVVRAYWTKRRRPGWQPRIHQNHSKRTRWIREASSRKDSRSAHSPNSDTGLGRKVLISAF